MLRLISYLAPSIPAGFFAIVARTIAEGCGTDVDLRFDETISGPLPGDENPFADGSADVGFVCAPTYQWLRGELELLPVPVPADARAAGRPVYFADVVVHVDSTAATFEDLRGRRWAFNDRNSRSGWFSMIDRIAPASATEYFSELIHAGSHLQSLRLLEERGADAAAIDSNVLLGELTRKPALARSLRTLESWGPFPIQPIVIRADVPASVKQAAREALIRAHEVYGEELKSFGVVRFVDIEPSAYQPQ